MNSLIQRGMLQRNSRRRRNQSPLQSVEILESRELLSADPSASLLGANTLLLNPDSYDPSSILVRYQTEFIDATPIAFDFEGLFDPVTVGAGTEMGLVPGLHKVSLPEGVSVQTAIAAFRVDPNVIYAEPNYHIELQVTPTDPDFDSLWGLNNTGQTGGTVDADIDAAEGWEFTTGTGSTLIAIIDTGVDYTHEDLAANIWVNPGEIAGDGIDNDGNGFIDDIHGYDFFNFDANPMDDNNHGTHVAGTIGAVANNGIGVTGINWNATIMPVKFLSSTGGGSLSGAIEAINYAVENGAKISNNSWGFNGGFSQPLFDAVQAAQNAGHIFVAAAGNGDGFGNGLNNDATAFYPSNFELDNVVAVAATDHNDAKATFSNYGATTVDVGAPGVGILSTTIGDTYSTYSGTSMATPHVTGLLSLILDQNPGWDYHQAIGHLYETVEIIPALDGITVTGGRINAQAALGPDVFGPRVLKTDPGAYTFDPFSSVRLSFSEAVDPLTFKKSDVLSFTGPNGPISVNRLDSVAGTNNRIFDVSFAEQSILGDYSMVLSENISDPVGNLMDQDRDGVTGEPLDDRFHLNFSLVPFFAKLDFGLGGSPVAAGFQQVEMATAYTSERGFGWSSGTIESRDRGASFGDDLTRDFNITELGTFRIDVPAEPAIYAVKITMGDALADRNEMGVFMEGALFDSVDTAPGEYQVNTYQVTVSDGQLTLTLDDLGGDDLITVINGLEVNAIGSDTFGPQVTASDPGEEFSGMIDRFTLTFSEVIDETTFSLTDVVSLTGPSGAITPLSINQVSAIVYEIVFDPQTKLGVYSLTIGPGIADVAGNLMDQNGDGINGGDPADRYTATATLVPVPPFEAHYDFGTASSPVVAGYTRVAPTNTYSEASGFGWQSGTIDSRDRGATSGDELQRDFNFTAVGTFGVDVPDSGVYQVTITMGDGLAARDEMGVFLEEIQVGNVTSPSGGYVTSTYQATVSDGQLTLLLDDLGGSDPLVMINSLDVLFVGPDTSGPQVASTDPAVEVVDLLNRIVVTFDEAMNASTFTVDDVSLSGPSSAVSVSAVNSIGTAAFEILFATQTEIGAYTLTLGPGITDSSGNLMNQDGDAINGEAVQDQFVSTMQLIATPPFERHYDFGTVSSPVTAGYTRIAETTGYSATQGYGWSAGTIASRDRGSSYGNELERDMNLTELGTFTVDVLSEPTIYDVTITMGDGLAIRDEMGISIEGVLLGAPTSPSGQYVTNTYRISVADGQLTLLLDDLGGSNTLVAINGLDIVEVGPDTAGPQVLSTNPAGEATGSLEQIVITFDEAIDAASFTTADVISLTGPAGAVTPTAVTQQSANSFAVQFDAQTAMGDYTITIGPEVADAAGNLMNQDRDGLNGEDPDDRFSTTVTLAGEPVFELHFDFGDAGSPLAAGYTRVAPNYRYSSTRGYGWTSGLIYSRDRGAYYGNAMERDFNFTQLGTFVADVPAGTAEYDVTVTMGDALALRDEMGVFLEGNLAGILTAPARTYAIETFRVTVSDGQLTLLLDDLGGSNTLVMINGLEIVEVQAGAGAASFDSGSGTTLRSKSVKHPKTPSVTAPTFLASSLVWNTSLRSIGGGIDNDSQNDEQTIFEADFLVVNSIAPVVQKDSTERDDDEAAGDGENVPLVGDADTKLLDAVFAGGNEDGLKNGILDGLLFG